MLRLLKEIKGLRKQNQELQEKVQESEQTIKSLEEHNEILRISVKYFHTLVYGRRSEKLSRADDRQSRLFDEAEVHADPAASEQ